uniref:Uncharacterized protein n=1 Tax=Arundo donax TaxID=35708 RepID=A0A0A8ZAA8_ARUDO
MVLVPISALPPSGLQPLMPLWVLRLKGQIYRMAGQLVKVTKCNKDESQ